MSDELRNTLNEEINWEDEKVPRYVDGDKIIDHINSRYKNQETYEFADEVIRYIEAMPAGELVPVIHARWVPNNDGCNERQLRMREKDHSARDFICSNCHYERWTSYLQTLQEQTKRMPYCPHCGAKMDEVAQ